jgi:hypothetical protein
MFKEIYLPFVVFVEFSDTLGKREQKPGMKASALYPQSYTKGQE